MKSLSEMTEREYLANVGQRPGMFVGKTSFHMLTSFLTGYDQHALRHGGHGLTGWHDWFLARRGRDCNHAWPGQVLHIALPHGWDDIWNLPPKGRAARDQGPIRAPRRVRRRVRSSPGHTIP